MSDGSMRHRRYRGTARFPRRRASPNHYQQALALADELGMRPLVAHCHYGLGTLYAKTANEHPYELSRPSAYRVPRP